MQLQGKNVNQLKNVSMNFSDTAKSSHKSNSETGSRFLRSQSTSVHLITNRIETCYMYSNFKNKLNVSEYINCKSVLSQDLNAY